CGSLAATTISRVPMPSLLRMGSSACKGPMIRFVIPLEGKTIDRRAGCGRSARPVRREGESNPIGPPYPYHRSAAPAAERWTPAFPTDQVRGRQAHGEAGGAWWHTGRGGGAGGGVGG